MRVEVTTPRAAPPVSLAEAKAHLGVDYADDDAMIAAMVEAATDAAERYLSRSIGTQTLTAYLDLADLRFPLALPRGPVQSVEAVTATDDAGAEAVADPASYVVAGDRLALSTAPGAPPFDVDVRPYEGLAVRYVAGWSDVPEPVRSAVLVKVRDLYDHRGSVVVGTVSSEVPQTAASLLAPFARFSV